MLRALLSSRFLAGALITLFVQQAAVGLSVFFITLSATSLPDANLAFFWFAWFVLSLVFPYFPGLLSNFLFELWTMECVRKFQSEAIDTICLRPTDFTSEDLRESKSTVFANTAPIVIQDTCAYVHELASTALNSLFSIFAIAAVVSGDLLISYGVSLSGCILYTWWFSSRAALKAEFAEDRRVAVVSHSENVWPVLTLGNKAFNKQWRAVYAERFREYWEAAKAEKVLRNSSSLALSLISVVPTAGLLTWLFYYNLGDPKGLAALLVTAPRVFQLLTMLGYFSSLLFETHHLKGRVAVLGKMFDVPAYAPRHPAGQGMQALWEGQVWDLRQGREGFLTSLAEAKSGRVLITGPNGSGKSTLLLQIKELLGDDAVYVPAQPVLTSTQSVSSGERKLIEIKNVLALDDVRYLLLDEWDANLDHDNLDKVDAALHDAAHSKLVIEVRHRATQATWLIC